MSASLSTVDLHTPLVDAVLDTASSLLDMELVAVSAIHDGTHEVRRTHGSLASFHEGAVSPLDDTLCGQMLLGAPHFTSDVRSIPAYADLQVSRDTAVRSFASTPIEVDDEVLGTLCGMDRETVEPHASTLDVLVSLAEVIGAYVVGARATTVRRGESGWQVGRAEVSDLTSAMTLADLLDAELTPGVRPSQPAGELDETARLHLAIAQLEHALSARVTVEQAIGVITERFGVVPRTAFDLIRKSARSRGTRVHDLARDVVASATDGSATLPDGLSG